jgi:ABC-2 type transport system ATP-binding protein
MNAPIVQVSGLSAGYAQRRVLVDVDLVIEPGEWLSLLGPNGSGKSTFLYCISGQLTPGAGTVLVGGENMTRAPERAKRALGYAHPPDRLPTLLTGEQCLEITAAAHNLTSVGAEVATLSDRLHLTPLLTQLVDTYSLGTRQKLSMLLALLGDPALILLDESFNGLDPASTLILKGHLQQRVAAGRCSVLLATHTLSLVLQCSSRVGLLLEGRLVRIWSKQEVALFRAGSIEAFECELAAASMCGLAK